MNGWFALAGFNANEGRRLAALISRQFHWVRQPELVVRACGTTTLGLVGPGPAAIVENPETGHLLVGSIRLDAAAELRESLGDGSSAACSHEDVVLAAFRKCSDSFLDHLAGDFNFAIWNPRTESLIAARDHFGVRPLYYTSIGPGLAISNSLGALAVLPGIAEGLDRQWIADFLLFEQTLNEEATVYKGIRRVPRGGALVWNRVRTTVKKYWSLSYEYSPPSVPAHEYPAAFRELLRRAVQDRVVRPTGIALSGGLDSSSIAALAVAEIGGRAVKGFTQLWADPDPEKPYVENLARHFGMDVEFVKAHDVEPFAGDLMHRMPEPFSDPLREAARQFMDRAARFGSLVLSGEGADGILTPATLGEGIGWADVARGAVPFFLRRRRLPPVGLRTRLKGKAEPPAALPAWLKPEFARATGLGDRLQLWEQRLAMPAGPRRRSWRALTQVAWLPAIEQWLPEFTGHPVTVSYPFLDLRVVKFGLSVPPIPWCLNKELLRTAVAGLLPRETIERPKTPFGPDTAGFAISQWNPPGGFLPLESLQDLVEVESLPRDITKVPQQVLTLAFWLNSKRLLP